jgi:hypothetical protein
MAGAGSTRSAALTVKLKVAPPGPVASSVTVPLGIELNEGAVVSVTVTLKVPGAEVLFDESFAVQATEVVPSGNVDPEG